MTRRKPPVHWSARKPASTLCARDCVSAPVRERDPNWRPGDPNPSQWTGAIRVTVAEAATLQGFRPDYPWQGARTRIFTQIGNAVCPPLARLVIAEAIRPTVASCARKGVWS